MTTQEILSQAIAYFGSDRSKLKAYLLGMTLDGSDYFQWKKELKMTINQPFRVQSGIFEDVTCWLEDNEIEKIDLHWVGDLSWLIEVVLNEGVNHFYDGDTKLAKACNGTTRFMQVFVSDVIPCYTVGLYYQTYNHKANYYESGPIRKLSIFEKSIIQKVKKLMKSKNLTYLNKKDALKEHKELYSDCNSEGGATLYDALFSDTIGRGYLNEIVRMSNKEIKDISGVKMSWREYYNQNNELTYRTEHRYYPSKDIHFTKFDAKGHIIEVKVWSKIDDFPHTSLELDILKEMRKKRKKWAKEKEASTLDS